MASTDVQATSICWCLETYHHVEKKKKEFSECFNLGKDQMFPISLNLLIPPATLQQKPITPSIIVQMHDRPAIHLPPVREIVHHADDRHTGEHDDAPVHRLHGDLREEREEADGRRERAEEDGDGVDGNPL